MKIIDAHIHFVPGEDYFDGIAVAAGHLNTEEHLREQFRLHDICHAVVMGNHDLEPGHRGYPDFVSYCVGLDGGMLAQTGPEDAAVQVEEHLRRKNCVGIKLYPGYCQTFVSDPVYEPFYQLAEQYEKPVAIHTGATSSARALLKYSHPLTLDEVAVRHPRVQLVMCHFGNPWLCDAAAVLEKNRNISADLSGLLEGRVDVDGMFAQDQGYLDLLRAWLHYTDLSDRLMYGTDWPLVNVEEYIDFISRLLLDREMEPVFFGNANRIYRLGL